MKRGAGDTWEISLACLTCEASGSQLGDSDRVKRKVTVVGNRFWKTKTQTYHEKAALIC